MQVVVVKWLDSITFGHWTSKEEVEKSVLSPCYASGFLVRQDDKVVTVALLISRDKESFSNWINIPTQAVLEVSVIREVDWDMETKEDKNA